MLPTDRNYNTSFKTHQVEDILFFINIFLIIWTSRRLHLILLYFGMISHVVTTFSRKHVFGYIGMVYAMVYTGVL
jgi:heme/copper-type cytochrome/quinol oxidase subunit 1